MAAAIAWSFKKAHALATRLLPPCKTILHSPNAGRPSPSSVRATNRTQKRQILQKHKEKLKDFPIEAARLHS